MKYAAFWVSLMMLSGWTLAVPMPMPGRCLLHETFVANCSCDLDTEVTPPRPNLLNLDSGYTENIDVLR